MSSSDTDPSCIIERCEHCSQEMDVSSLRPYSNAICPACKGNTRVLARMGVYRITDKIGVGGMSVVYRAEDTILGREVALKVLNEVYGAQPERIARFEDEAKIMARVQHDHMVKVYGVGQQWGYFYIAMELVDGGDLESRVREHGAMPESQVLDIAFQVADGLETAWEAGMLHRDIKPANILLDSSGTAKVVDFGLSLLSTQENTEQEIWATPYYASPETLTRQSEDFRADMYALGCSLYQLLLGKPPFEKIPDTISGILDVKKKLPPLQKVAPEVSPLTCEIVNRLMAYSPQKRYDSYAELKKDLQLARLECEGRSNGNWLEKRRTLLRRKTRSNIKKGILIGCAGIVLVSGVLLVVSLAGKQAADQPEVSGGNALPPGNSSPDTVVTKKLADIGELYKSADTALRKGDISSANRTFALLLAEEGCPVSTYAWAALQSVLCSWALGSQYEGDSLLRNLDEKLQQTDQGQITPRVQELSRLVHYLATGKGSDAPPDFPVDSIMQPYLVAANILKNWEQCRFNEVLALRDKLTGMSQQGTREQSDAVVVWNPILKPFIDDASVIDQIKKMPQATEQEISVKEDVVRQAGQKQTSPGIAYRQALKLIETELDVAKEELKARQTELVWKDDGDNGIEGDVEMVDRNVEPEDNRVAGDSLPQTFYSDNVKDMARNWNFGKIADSFIGNSGKTADTGERIKFQTIGEMGKIVDDFLKKMSKNIAELQIADRMAILADGSKVTITGLDTDHLYVQGLPSGQNELPLNVLGVNNLINLHRQCVSQCNLSPEEIKKRHAAAVVFLYLMGQKEQAEKTASIIAGQDEDFARDWKRWQLILKD